MKLPKMDPVRARNASLGLVALALFATAIWLTWTFLKGDFRGGMPVSAEFSSAGVGQQLPVGGDVKIRGVLVGHIADITLADDTKAVVELALDEGLDLPADTAAEIRSKTIFGQKWVELLPPQASASGDVLIAGSVIPDERTQEPLEFESALQLGHDLLVELPLDDLSEVFRVLAEGFSGQEDAAQTAIDKGLVALRAVNARADELDLGLRQLREFSEWLNDNDDDLVSFMASLDEANRALVAAAPEFRASNDSLPRFLNDLSDFQTRVEKDLGRLVEDGATITEIVAARSDQLTDLVVQLEPFLKVWNSGLRQPCEGEYESDLTCWQVYQLPGLESRGVYRGSAAPDRDEPGDPNFGAAALSDAAFDALLTEITGKAHPSELMKALFAPAQEALPELAAGR